MTWLPISGTLPQFTTDGEQANGYVLKFYQIGTTTPLTVSSSNTGTPTTTDFLLDTEGYTTLSAVRVIPHVQTGYKLICYLNQTDADANDTGSAVWTIDSITLASTQGSVTGVDNIIELAAVNTTFFQTAILKGTNTVDDGGQGAFYFDINSTATPNGTTVIAPDTGTGRWLILNVETLWIGDNAVTTPKISDDAVTTDKILDANVTPDKLSFTPIIAVNEYRYTSNGTYTPNADTVRIDITAIGGGGGGGGSDGQGAGTNALANHGGGGGYSYKSTSTIDASYAIVIGSGGTGGATGDNDGTAGGATTVTSTSQTISGGGGGLGEGITGAGGLSFIGSTDGGASSGGDINVKGSPSIVGIASAGNAQSYGSSGSSYLGGGMVAGVGDGVNATSIGVGGTGGGSVQIATNYAGGDGADGIVIIKEYVSS